MTQRIDLRLTGLLALTAALAAPATFAQSTTATEDAAQTATTQPATSMPQSDAAPAKKTWADLDTDKDGNLNKSEVATIPSLEAVFDQADANADGALSGDEYKTYLAANGTGKGTQPPKPKK